MACWTDMYGWVKTNYPEASPDDVARHAVAGLHQIIASLGGLRQYHTATGNRFTLPIPEGFMITQVYAVTADECCLPYCRECAPNCRPCFDADNGVVELHNYRRPPDVVKVEYGIQLAANAVACDVDDSLFAKFAPAMAEWVKAQLAVGRDHRSARRMSADNMILFGHMVNQFKREMSRRGYNRQVEFKGTFI